MPTTWAVDLDGVVWLAGKALPGSAEAVRRLRQAGQRVAFLTNNSGPRLEDHLSALAAIGIECAPSDLVTSAQAAASMVEEGTRVCVVGAEGIFEALAGRGAQVVPPTEAPEAVVVGRTVALDYSELAAAAAALREGARFIATNTDATFPSEGGLLPGAGAIVAFLATASGRRPEVAGKPHGPMAGLVRGRFGHLDVVAGDRPDTDGLFARRCGAVFGLVLSGVTKREDLPTEPAPDLVAEHLLGLVEQWLATSPCPQTATAAQPGWSGAL